MLGQHLAKTLYIFVVAWVCTKLDGYTSFLVVDNVPFEHLGQSSAIIVSVHNTSVLYGGASHLMLATSKTNHRPETKLTQAKAHRYQR